MKDLFVGKKILTEKYVRRSYSLGQNRSNVLHTGYTRHLEFVKVNCLQ